MDENQVLVKKQNRYKGIISYQNKSLEITKNKNHEQSSIIKVIKTLSFYINFFKRN